jgi:hypothetical protein
MSAIEGGCDVGDLSTVGTLRHHLIRSIRVAMLCGKRSQVTQYHKPRAPRITPHIPAHAPHARAHGQRLDGRWLGRMIASTDQAQTSSQPELSAIERFNAHDVQTSLQLLLVRLLL